MARLARMMASGALAAILRAVPRVSSRSRSGAHNRLTSPHSSACSAVNGSPVRMISLARRMPTAPGRFWVPMQPGMMPSVVSVRANRALLDA